MSSPDAEIAATATPAANYLSNVPLFKSLESVEVNRLAQLLTTVEVAAGTTVFEQSDAGDAMYVVKSGRVRIWTRDEDQHEVTLAELEAGTFFGELAVLDGAPRSANASAVVNSTLAVLTRKDFHSFMLAHPSVALEMIQEIGVRLRQTNQIVSQRVVRNVNEVADEKMTVGERVADRVASFGGSWTFVLIFGGLLVLWMSLNTYIAFARTGNPADPNGSFDPFPFIALNLLLSSLAAFQAPFIMMSQNRSAQKDRLSAENDFKVNLNSELLLKELTARVERLEENKIDPLLKIARGDGQNGQAAAAMSDSK